MPENAESDVITTPAAAALLGISVDTLVKEADAGAVPCWKTQGGHRRFRRSALLGLLEQRTSEPAEATG